MSASFAPSWYATQLRTSGRFSTTLLSQLPDPICDCR